MRPTWLTGLFVALLCLVDLVGDGPPKLGSPLDVQIGLLPITGLFLFLLFLFLWRRIDVVESQVAARVGVLILPGTVLWILLLLQVKFAFIFFYETVHFRSLGYRRLLLLDACTLGGILSLLVVLATFHRRVRPLWMLLFCSAAYAAEQILAIVSFPLNYLRSDMLPVIVWADRALLMHQSPYQHFRVAERIYDFPYLPGMMMAFLPAVFLHLDPRWATTTYSLASGWLIYYLSGIRHRQWVASLIGLFLLCPYFVYRHELYTQGHFLSLVVIFALMHRRRFGWSALAFGLSMVISQFSWVIFPFFVLNGYRRARTREALRLSSIALGSALLLLAPFRGGSVAYNAVGQWDNLEHAIARPMNLSFWATYIVHPDHLKWVQLFLLSSFFGFCWLGRRCGSLEDTMRCMITALIVFILLNVLVDGYFYLMLLVPMLVYTCVANGWWGREAAGDFASTRLQA